MVVTCLVWLGLIIIVGGFFAPDVHADAKGQWGRAVPIADNNHPNLFWNQAEIDQLRNMVLVQKSPQILVDIYNNKMKNVLADTGPVYWGSFGISGWQAAISYMIEPSQAKAAAIRTALLNYMNQSPDGIPDWYSAGCFCGYPLAEMFDLIQAYHPSTLSTSEKTQLKAWFKKSAEYLKVDSNDPRKTSQSGTDWPDPPTRHEGKLVAPIPNWYTRYMGPSLAAAFVSGDQAAVDYWADSGWPHNLFTFEGVTPTYPDDTANRYDMVTSLLAIYPSGADIESYTREGLWTDGDPYTWNTKNYYAPTPRDGGTYHFAQTQGPIMGAIMSYHNGVSQVFTITDVPGTEPAILRNFKRAIRSRTERDENPTSLTGHPSIGYEPFIWIAHRFYPNDAMVQGALPGLNMNILSGADFWDVPNEAILFLAHPVVPRTPPLPAPRNLQPISVSP